MKNQKQTLSENSVILIFSTIIVKIIGAIFKIPLATDTFLGDIGFGYYSIAHDLFMPFYVLAISGLPAAVSHFTASNLAENNFEDIKFNFTITKKLFKILGVLFSLFVAIISIPLIMFSDSGIETIYSIIVILPSIFLCFLISVYRGYFEGFNNMYPTAISKIIEAVFKLIFGLIFAYITIKTTSNPAIASAAAIFAVSVGTLISTIYLQLKFKFSNPIKSIPKNINTSLNKISLKNIFILALPFALSSLITSIVSLIDVFTVKIQIANACDSYFKALSFLNINENITTYLYGIRSKSFTLFNLVPTITMSLGVGALPLLTKLKANNDKSALESNVNFVVKLITTIALPAGIGMTVLSGPIINLLFSSKNALEGNILAIFGIAAIFAGISVPLINVLQSFGLQYKVLKHMIFALLIKVITNTVLATFSFFNIYSTAIGTAICYAYLSIIFMVLIKKNVNFDFKNSFYKPFSAAILCGICAFIISKISSSALITMLSILVGVLVYFSALIISRCYSKNELEELPIINKLINTKKSFK